MSGLLVERQKKIDLAYIEGEPLAYTYRAAKSVQDDVNFIREYGSFNHVWYKKVCELRGISIDTVNIVKHYLTVGAALGLDPEHNFDTRFYLKMYDDVRLSGLNPYVHYLKYGNKGGRKPYRYKFVCREMQHLVITTDGNVSPCSVDVRMLNTFGNIYQESYASLREKFIKYRLDLFRNPHKYPGCVECLHNCNGESGGVRLVDYCTLSPDQQKVAVYFDQSLEISTRFHIEPASICNSRCSTCFIIHDDFTREVDLMDFDRVIESFGGDIKEATYIQLFYYGEPFLNPQTTRFLRYLSDNAPKAKVVFSTNGVYLKAEYARDIIEVSRKVPIIVWNSLHGSRQENSRKYMGKTFMFDTAVANFNYLSSLRTPDCNLRLVWKYVLFSWNDSVADLAELEHAARENGYDAIMFTLTKQPSPSTRFRLGSKAWQQFAINKTVIDTHIYEYDVHAGLPIQLETLDDVDVQRLADPEGEVLPR